MALFDFEKYGTPTGEVFITNIDDSPFVGYNLDQYIEDRNVILVGIPGAFTPTCTEKHLPGFVKHEKEFYDKGFDEIICLSVNDPHVMLAFDDYINADGANITMAADPFGEVAEQLGLLTDMGTLGKRSKRFAAIVKNGKLEKIFVDDKGLDKASAENCLVSINN